ncbi:MAG: ATP-binding cassette domain-containing protein, partial [Pseudomonadota bacterium]
MSQSVVSVVHVSKHFDSLVAVDDISFEIAAGSTTALLGGNGAGKTTTLSMLLGLLSPTAGAIAVFGHDMLRDRYAVLPRMNFSSPYVDLPRRLTVRQNLS